MATRGRTPLMETLLRLEEAALFVLGLALFIRVDVAWWWFPVLLLAPDLGMLGYAAGRRVGAATYNLLHHRAAGVILYVLGLWASSPWAQAIGLILFAHAGMDRLFGYGLKTIHGFHATHLGPIGPARSGRRQ